MSLVGPRPCIPYETEHFEPHHFERFPVPAGHHRPLAGDGAGALDLRRGARDGRRSTRAAGRSGSTSCCCCKTPVQVLPAEGDRDERRRSASRSSASATGGRTSCATSSSSTRPRSSTMCDLRAGAARALSGAATRPSRRTTSYLEVRRRPSVDAVVIATPVSTHYELAVAGARSPASTCSSRSRSRRARARRPSSSRLARRAGLVLMPGHTFLYSPPVVAISELIDSGELGEHLLHLVEPGQPRAAPARRERRLGPRPARLLDPALLARRAPTTRLGDEPRLRHPGHARRRVHQPRATPSGTIAHVELAWLAPSKLRRTAVVGSERMVVYDDTSSEPVRVFDSGATLRDPETFGEYQLSYRTGDIVSPRVEPVEPLLLQMEDFCRAVRERRRAALVGSDRHRGRRGRSRRSTRRSRAKGAPVDVAAGSHAQRHHSDCVALRFLVMRSADRGTSSSSHSILGAHSDARGRTRDPRARSAPRLGRA